MLKQLIKKITLLSLLFPFLVQAQSVDVQLAEDIALQFIEARHPGHTALQTKSVQSETKSSAEVGNLFHVINLLPQGFVVVAGNKRFSPILAYSTENNIDFTEHQNAGVIYLNGQAHSIEQQLKNSIDEPIIDEVIREWDTYESGALFKTANVVVAPLTTTKWGQETYYNALCPVDQFGVDDKTFAGCITLSLAQLLKYHGHPARGNGTNQYDDYNYGTQTADFGSTLYPWDSMPDELLDYNDDVARAIFHAAVSINTEFSTVYTAAYFTPVRNALVYNFGYDRSAQFVKRITNPTGLGWYELIERELEADRPALMRADAFGSGAHSWLIDGYDEDGFYHMNWGWAGAGNGWYKDISVQWEWVEGGTNAFYNDMDMIYNIFPSPICQDYESTVDMYVPGKTETSATLALFPYAGTITNQFRLRELGSTTWIESEISNELTRVYDDLVAGTEYEFQVRAMCSEIVWNNYSDSFTFKTPGVACVGLEQDQLSSGSVLTDAATITTGQPYGPANNQFQYRVLNAVDWTDTEISTVYLRNLENLLSGTTYEYRVRHECTPGVWSEYSAINTFTTQGDAPDTGACSSPTFFLATSITDTYAYLIGSDLTAAQSNQFRYRVAGSSTWTETEVSNDNFRLIQNLMPGTEYAFSVRETCADGNWSSYAETQFFSTTGIAPIDNTDACEAPFYLLTSSTGNHASYIYLGYGTDAENQFRYRSEGGAWLETGVNNVYYRYIENLSSGTSYEFQARERCEGGQWSDYGESAFFETTGGSPSSTNACTLDQDSLDQDDYYFYYFTTGFLQLEIQWRYNSGDSWSSPYGTVHHYAAIVRDLGITQNGAEVRVRIQCADGSWTDYSEVYQLQ